VNLPLLVEPRIVPPWGEDAGDVPRVERDVADGINESLIAAQEADAAVAESFGAAGGGTDDGVEPGAVPADSGR